VEKSAESKHLRDDCTLRTMLHIYITNLKFISFTPVRCLSDQVFDHLLLVANLVYLAHLMHLELILQQINSWVMALNYEISMSIAFKPAKFSNFPHNLVLRRLS
jgi:hypothetical protein